MIFDVLYNDPNPGIITKLRVKEGKKVMKTDVLCEYRTSKKNLLKSNWEGVVMKICKHVDQTVKFGDKLAIVKRCCEVDADKFKPEMSKVSMEYFRNKLGFPSLLVYRSNPIVLSQKYTKELLMDKKLVLIVDLDETIIHTLEYDEPQNFKEIFRFRVQKGGAVQHTKLRPYVHRFLKNISNYYELQIFTFGSKAYANAIVKYLDPQKKYFQNRILSREDSINKKCKAYNLEHMFPGGDNMVCIIDDLEKVWQSVPNMIPVKPYTFVPQDAERNIDFAKCRITTALQKDEFSCLTNEGETDDYLLRLEEVLMNIHSSFYKQYEKNPQSLGNGELDLKKIVPQRKRKVLKDCNIFFSDVVIPKHNLKDSWAYRLAVNYGASVQTRLVVVGQEKTTHVVGFRECRREEEMARKHNIAMVSIDWLVDSIEKWERVDDTLYPISKGSSRRYEQYKDFKGYMKPVQ